jgi:hypothetical protein
MSRYLSKSKLTAVIVAAAAVALAAGVHSVLAGGDPQALPPEKQQIVDFERAQQNAATARERLLHPDRRSIPKPPATLPDPIKPEVSGIIDGVSSPYPASVATLLDHRGYQVVEGARVRAFFGVVFADGTTAIVIMNRPNLSVSKATPKITFKTRKSPLAERGLHITGAEAGHLQLRSDRGRPISFNISTERFGN